MRPHIEHIIFFITPRSLTMSWHTLYLNKLGIGSTGYVRYSCAGLGQVRCMCYTRSSGSLRVYHHCSYSLPLGKLRVIILDASSMLWRITDP